MAEKQSVAGWIHLISNLTRLYHARKMWNNGLKPGQYSFLVTLYSQEGLTQDELSRKVGSDKSHTSRTLAEMERIGLVRREADPENHRVKRVYLKPEARKIENTFDEIRKRWHGVLFDGFSEERRDRLFHDLREMAQNAEKYLFNKQNKRTNQKQLLSADIRNERIGPGPSANRIKGSTP